MAHNSRPVGFMLVIALSVGAPAEELEGRVRAVDGEVVTVVLDADAAPQVGDPAMIYFKLEGIETPVQVCDATVEAVQGREVRLRTKAHESPVQAGYFARITSERPGGVDKEGNPPERPDPPEDSSPDIETNETSACQGLTRLNDTLRVWREVDADRNGSQDYWTRDVAGFHFMQGTDGAALEYIDVELAMADRLGIASYTDDPPRPRNGYWYRAMKLDEDGHPYIDDSMSKPEAAPMVGRASTNASKYGFCAWPAEYGVSGVHTYVVSEEEVVYRKDLGPGSKDGCDALPGRLLEALGWEPVFP